MPCEFDTFVFDAYGTLFDVYSVKVSAERLYPGQGEALAKLWRDKQVEYTRLISLADPSTLHGSRHYMPFWEVTRRALHFSLCALGLDASQANQDVLMTEYEKLSAFPEVFTVLSQLKDEGHQVAILSNGNQSMLNRAVESAGLTALIDRVLGVDELRQFKIMPMVYDLIFQGTDVPKDKVLFVSSNGWDVLGANWYGLNTFWVNRQGLPFETLGPAPKFTGRDLGGLLALGAGQG
jgi:2-haloacid dehalogenase